MRDLWNDLLCKVFGHRWMNLEPKFLADALKDKYDIPLDLNYRYCYRCGLLEQNCGNNFDNVYDRGKIHLDYLPWTTDGTGLPWPPNHPFLEWCTSVKYFFVHLWEWPGDTYREIKFFIQRGRRGYSDRDIWALDGYLSDIIIAGCKKLKETKHGVPSALICDKDGKQIMTVDEGIIEFNKILDKIIRAFELEQKILEQFILSDEENKEREEGWKLFENWFHSLWD